MSATRQPRAVLAAVLVLLQAQPSTSIRRGDLFGLRRRERQLHWHHDWEEGMRHSLRWYKADWVASITDFFCDPSCQERIKRAPTIDREFKALVHLFNMTTGGPRSPVYRGAFEGLGEYQLDQAGGGAASRRDLSRNKWRHMDGWESILTAHTSTQTLCTELKLDVEASDGTIVGDVDFHRDFCYDNIAPLNSGCAPAASTTSTSTSTSLTSAAASTTSSSSTSSGRGTPTGRSSRTAASSSTAPSATASPPSSGPPTATRRAARRRSSSPKTTSTRRGASR